MAGLEPHLRSAIQEAKLRLSVLEESVQPHYRVFLDALFVNSAGEFMTRKATGRTENAVLTLYDARKKRDAVRYQFRLTDDHSEQRKAARRFVELINSQFD